MRDGNRFRHEACRGRAKGILPAILVWAVAVCCGPMAFPQELQAKGVTLRAGSDAGDEASPSVLSAKGVRLAQSSSRGGESWTRREERVISGGDEPTKVQIRGNSVLVPVTLVYGGREADVNLLLDTGASTTTIHTGVADQLSIDLARAKKARVQVVGGEVLEARVVSLDRLTVGSHTRRNVNVVVVPHKGPAARYDGLLGMDVLRGLKYRIDFKKQVILWE